MKKENKNTGCAGFCAGKVNQTTKTKPQFQKVTDHSCRPIRGLWKRGKRFYARVSITLVEYSDNDVGGHLPRHVLGNNGLPQKITK